MSKISMPDAYEIVETSFMEGLRPKERLSVWEWADKYRMLSSKDSSEPGKYRTDRTPYLKEIMEELSSSSLTKVVVLKKGAQVGATAAGLNFLGYIVDHEPGMTMVVWPSLPDAKKNSKIRLDPMIESNPRILKKIAAGNNRDAKNTGFFKDFEGGALIISGANSASSLRSVPAKNLFLDEIDAYPDDVEGEGDPISLCLARSKTFPKRKAFMVSTPTFKGRSKIDKRFRLSDQRYFYVPCPHCKKLQVLGHSDPDRPLDTFENLRFTSVMTDDGQEVVESASYFCKHCGEEIQEYNKTWMFSQGEWIKHNPKSNVAGFHLSGIYSPLGWYSWRDLCQEYVDARNSKDTESMKTFINTALGEVYEDVGEKPVKERLFQRRESYTVCPSGVVFLTCAIDVQEDRLELEVHGWGRGREKWVIERHIISGSPKDSETWDEAEDFITRSFPHQKGYQLSITKTAVDTGYKASEAYAFCRRFDARRVIPIKGRDDLTVMIGLPKAVDVKENERKIRRGVKLWSVGTNIIKAELYGDLQKDPPKDVLEKYPPGFIHFPEMDEEYFSQLVSEERRIKKNNKGFAVVEWHKIRDRNETLDLHVYNRAAASLVGVDRFKEEDWQRLEMNIMVVKNIKRKENQGEAQKVKKKRDNSGYWG